MYKAKILGISKIVGACITFIDGSQPELSEEDMEVENDKYFDNAFGIKKKNKFKSNSEKFKHDIHTDSETGSYFR
tara:strand:- start:124 stop:348 length:225 start_codon:yes stop_codon:yes gene_type:complete